MAQNAKRLALEDVEVDVVEGGEVLHRRLSHGEQAFLEGFGRLAVLPEMLRDASDLDGDRQLVGIHNSSPRFDSRRVNTRKPA